jgi:hypothetical protein
MLHQWFDHYKTDIITWCGLLGVGLDVISWCGPLGVGLNRATNVTYGMLYNG